MSHGQSATQDPFAFVRARKALEEAGLDTELPLQRANSVTNEVWLAGEYVIRVNRQPSQRLRREAYLGPTLPRDLGYPEIVAYGGELGADWLIQRRQQGHVLSRAWPSLDRDERRRAVAQLATVLKRLHGAQAPADLPPIPRSPHLLSADTMVAVAPLLTGIERLAELPHMDRNFINELRSLVLDNVDAIEPFRSSTLIHGDLHFENVLWDGYVVTALLDMEYSRAAPADLELDIFLRFCAFPFLHVADDYEHLTKAEDYAEIPWWVADHYPELFDHPRIFDRMRLYCVSYDVRDLLDMPPQRPVRELSPLHAYHRLQRLLRGDSHIDHYAGIVGTSDDVAVRIAATGSPDGKPRAMAPLAAGAMEERKQQGSTLPLARRSRPADDEPQGDEPHADGPAGDEPQGDAVIDLATTAEVAPEPARAASQAVGYRIDGGDVVVTGTDGAERFRGRAGGGVARQLLVLPDGSGAVVLLDWAENNLPPGVQSWDPFPNVVCLGADGEPRWHGELPEGEKCYIELGIEGGEVIATSWAKRCAIDPATGQIATVTIVR